MKRYAAQVLFLVAIALAGRIDRVVAVIGEHVVLQSNVELSTSLEDVDPSPVPFWTRGAPIQRQIDAAIIDEAAGDVSLYRPTEASTRLRLETMRSHFPDREAWESYLDQRGMTEAELLAVLRHRMRVEAYLLRNIATDPANASAFDAATRQLLRTLRQRTRVRVIPPQGGDADDPTSHRR